jgi:hypothetical protein
MAMPFPRLVPTGKVEGRPSIPIQDEGDPMLQLRLTEGAPDQPDAGDWDAICDTPGPRQVFDALFQDLVGRGLPAETSHSVSEDDTHRVHTIWCGTDKLGLKVTEIESPETSALPMYCTWQTFGLPGMSIVWNYSLEYAGQLGYVAFRHGRLECSFGSDADLQRFVGLYQAAIGKTPVFAPVDAKGWGGDRR